MSLSIDGVWKTGVWAQTVWHAGVWFEGVQAPAVTITTGGGRRKKYPRRVMVRGALYTVRSLDDEIALLQAVIAAPPHGIEVAPPQVKRLQRRIKQVETERQAWLRNLRQADEELLLLLH